MGHRPGATIRTVADRAGVSTATVSYVLSGRSGGNTRVSEATRERVLRAAKELGWVPNQSARGMRRGKTDQICLVLRNTSSPWGHAMSEHVAGAMSAYQLSTLVLVGGDWEDFLLRRGADGAYLDLSGPAPVDRAGLRRVADRGVALVVHNEDLEPDGYDVVRTHDAEQCAEAMRLLLAEHRRIGWIGEQAPEDGVPESAVFRAYQENLAAAGIAYDARIVDGGSSREVVYRAALAMLARPDRPTAIFAPADWAAVSVLWAAQRLGIRVPGDLAIVGSGNSPAGASTEPQLTTVGPEAIFSDVADLLLSRLRGEAPPDGRIYEAAWRLHRRGTA